MTDTELLDLLQKSLGNYTGRGWRLHESSHPAAVSDVRTAITNWARNMGKV